MGRALGSKAHSSPPPSCRACPRTGPVAHASEEFIPFKCWRCRCLRPGVERQSHKTRQKPHELSKGHKRPKASPEAKKQNPEHKLS